MSTAEGSARAAVGPVACVRRWYRVGAAHAQPTAGRAHDHLYEDPARISIMRASMTAWTTSGA